MDYFRGSKIFNYLTNLFQFIFHKGFLHLKNPKKLQMITIGYH